MKRLLFAILFIAASLQAAEHRSVVIVIDPASGLALVPDGTEIPQGINVLDRDGKPRTFAHAPESAFTRARALVAATAPRDRELGPVSVTRERLDDAQPLAKAPRFRAAPDDSDVTYYVTFYDSSWISSRRIVLDLGGGLIYYGVQSGAYATSGDYYSGTVYAAQSSSDHPYYGGSCSTTINSSGGYCYTGTNAYESYDYFCAHVVTSGNIHHHRLPICGRYGEPPCEENLSGSIDIYFP